MTQESSPENVMPVFEYFLNVLEYKYEYFGILKNVLEYEYFV